MLKISSVGNKTRNVTTRRNMHISTRGTIHQQLSMNAERHQFPHPYISISGDDQVKFKDEIITLRTRPVP
jgi:hypothetical protein